MRYWKGKIELLARTLTIHKCGIILCKTGIALSTKAFALYEQNCEGRSKISTSVVISATYLNNGKLGFNQMQTHTKQKAVTIT